MENMVESMAGRSCYVPFEIGSIGSRVQVIRPPVRVLVPATGNPRSKPRKLFFYVHIIGMCFIENILSELGAGLVSSALVPDGFPLQLISGAR